MPQNIKWEMLDELWPENNEIYKYLFWDKPNGNNYDEIDDHCCFKNWNYTCSLTINITITLIFQLVSDIFYAIPIQYSFHI